MNKARRKRIEDIYGKLSNIKLLLSKIGDEEESALNNMPENLQSSDKYMEMEDSYELIVSAVDHIETAQYKLKEVYSDELQL